MALQVQINNLNCAERKYNLTFIVLIEPKIQLYSSKIQISLILNSKKSLIACYLIVKHSNQTMY